MANMLRKGLSILIPAAMTAGVMLAPITAGAATTRTASTAAELTSAISAAAAGDTIQLTGDIESASAFTISKAVILDLNGHDITVTASGTGSYAINVTSTTETSANIFTIRDTAGGGTVTSNGSAVYSATALVKMKIEGGTFTGGKAGIYTTSTSASQGIYITGGTFRGGSNHTNTTAYRQYDVYVYYPNTITNADFKSFRGNLRTGGTYDIQGLEYWYAGAQADVKSANVVFSNAKLDSGMTIQSGSYSGTVSDAKVYGTSVLTLRGGTYTDELKASLDSLIESGKVKFYSGFGWVDNFDGTWSIANESLISLKAASANTAYGTIGTMVVKQNSNQTSAPCNIIKDADVTITATATPKAGYELVGWYTNADGTGESLSTDEELNITTQFAESTTIYAVFRLSANDAANSWLGDYSSTTEYFINSTDDMEYFEYAVDVLGKNFKGKTVKLAADLDYAGGDHIPIGYKTPFAGTFDGQNHTISNANLLNRGDSDGYAGIFGYISNAAVKNLNISNVNIEGTWYGGGLAGRASGGTVDNVTVTGVYAPMTHSGGGLFGEASKVTVTNTSVSDVTVSYGRNGGICGIGTNMTITDVSISNISAAAAATGEVHGSSNVYKNITCNTPDKPFIGINGDTTPGAGVAALTLTGDNNITASQLLNSCNSGCSCTVESGMYTVDELVGIVGETAVIELQQSVKSSVKVPEEYVEEGYEVVKNPDGTYEVKEKVEITVEVSEAIAEKIDDDGATGFVATIDATGTVTVSDIAWRIRSEAEGFSRLYRLSKVNDSFKAMTFSGELQMALIVRGLYDKNATATVTLVQ